MTVQDAAGEPLSGHGKGLNVARRVRKISEQMPHPDYPAPGSSPPDRGIFDSSTDLMCVRDMQGRIIRVNRAWESTLGLSVDEVANTPLLPLVHPADVPATLSRMAEADRCDHVVDFVNRYRRRDGQYRHLEWRAQRIGDVVLGRARDITVRRLQEDLLRVATDTLEATLADISRTIRAPAEAISKTVQALRQQTTPTPVQLALIREIAGSVRTLEHLVSQMIERERNAAWTAFLGTIERKQADHGASEEDRVRRGLAHSPVARAIGPKTSRPVDADRSVEKLASETLAFLAANPVYDRSFRDEASRILGLSSISLAYRDQLYPRRLLGLSTTYGLMSRGRAAALLARMRDIGFVDVVGESRTGQIRRYRVMTSMRQAFVGRMVVDLKSLAESNYKANLALEKIGDDDEWATHVLVEYAEALLNDHISEKAVDGGRLNGVLSMAKGLSIALSIASSAAQKYSGTWEGWIDVALASHAQRFDVSPVHVRRVIDRLEPCGVLRDPASSSRLLITSRFRAEVTAYRTAMCDLLAGVLDRVI